MRNSRLGAYIVRRETDWLAAAWLLTIAVLYLWHLGDAPLMNPNEAQYAQIPREMLLRGEWITPYLDGARYLDKPPLAYWLGTLIFMIGGVSAASARLMSALPMLVQALVVYLLGKRAFGRYAGLLSLLVFSTFVSSYLYARNLMSDSLFACCLTVALACFHRALTDPRAGLWAWAAGSVAVSLAVMTKGFAGLILPVLALALVQLWLPWFATRRVVAVCAAVLLVTVLPWHLVVAWRHPGFLLSYVGNEQVMRFFDLRFPKDYYTLPCWLYLVIVLAFTFPWVFFVPAALRHAWRCRLLPSVSVSCRVFLCWSIVMIGFFAMSWAREPVYALPCYSALALLIGKLFVDVASRRYGAGERHFVELGIAALIPGFAAFAAVLPIAIEHLHRIGDFVSLQAPAIGSACAAVALATIAFLLARRRHIVAAIALVALLTIPILALVGDALAIVATVKSSLSIGTVLAERARPQDIIAMQSPADHEYENAAGLAFYGGGRVRLIRLPETPPLFWPLPAEQDFFLAKDDLEHTWASSKGVFLVGSALFVDSLQLPSVCWLMRHDKQWLVWNGHGSGIPDGPGLDASCKERPQPQLPGLGQYARSAPHTSHH
jgi:4-amino-4-deoxy-L-arabinose transferase-like glycosyltransferase